MIMVLFYYIMDNRVAVAPSFSGSIREEVKHIYYDQLLELNIRLKPNSLSFRTDVLLLLKELFGYDKVAFAYVTSEGYFSDFCDCNLRSGDYSLYLNKYSKIDFFVPANNDKKKCVCRIGDFMTYDEFEGTRIHEILSNCGFYYEAVMYLCYRQNPAAALIFYREKERDDFSEQELYLFEEIKKILEHQMILYFDLRDYLKELKEKEMMQKALQNMMEGIILCDDSFHVLFANDVVNDLVPDQYKTAGYDKFITEKLMPVFERQGQRVFFIPELPGITLTLKSFFVSNAEKELIPIYEILFMQSPLKANKKWVDFTSSKTLTNRENEISNLMLQGLDNYQIADYLHISVHTCKRHLENIYRKLGVSRRFELFTLFQRYSY
jgi:DNA-binding CsgD family transcriptional regulator